MSTLTGYGAAAEIGVAGHRQLTVAGREFRRGGAPHRILGGSAHYFRIHPDQWADRLGTLARMGLNTVDTYVAWNFHQRRPGPPDFTGWRDVERYLQLADRAGLDVIVRPGPYICAEWSGGGLPAWLHWNGPVALRCADPRYLQAVSGWFDELIPRIAALQADQGGPVVAMQVENEYGSYGDDQTYLRWVRTALTERGFRGLLFTSDGPTHSMLDAGSIPGVLSAVNFGSGAAAAADIARGRRPDDPFLCGEFWNGWFDHWGENHHVRSADGAADTVREILDLGGSLSLYMAHGGTNFGLWAGANDTPGQFAPTTTSYDSDAAIAEDGAPTEKFHTLRAALSDRPVPPLPDHHPDRLAPQVIRAATIRELLPALRQRDDRPGRAKAYTPLPPSFEQLRQPDGLVLYSARPTLPREKSHLSILGLADRAQVYLDGALLGTLDRNRPTQTLTLTRSGTVDLQILVEDQGRINYGPSLGQGKGMAGVQIDRRLVHGWTAQPIDLYDTDLFTHRAGGPQTTPGGPAIAEFDIPIGQPADGYLTFPGWAKGFAWINGFLLGRYWEIGPQTTLYVPAPLWRPGNNKIAILELERSAQTIELVAAPQLGPAEEYIEQL